MGEKLRPWPQQAAQAYTSAIGHELQDTSNTGQISQEANNETFEARAQQQLRANRLRAKPLSAQVLAYRELCDRTLLTFRQGDNLLAATRPILRSNDSLLDAIGRELDKYL